MLSSLAAAGSVPPPTPPSPMQGSPVPKRCPPAAVWSSGLGSSPVRLFLRPTSSLQNRHFIRTCRIQTCLPRGVITWGLQKCLTSINLPLPPLEKLFVFCFLNRAPLTSPRLSLSCAHSHQPRVTLSATQGRQSEHDAKTGRKSRVASGSPKESEDLGMETIKGKPELVCNTHLLSCSSPHSCAARWEPGHKESRLPVLTGGFRKPCYLQTTLLLGEGTAAQPGPGGASQPLWEREGGWPDPWMADSRHLAV